MSLQRKILNTGAIIGILLLLVLCSMPLWAGRPWLEPFSGGNPGGFRPTRISGLVMWLDARLSPKLGGSGGLVSGSSDNFQVADNTTLSMGNIDFEITGWFRLNALPGVGLQRAILGKWQAADLEYELLSDNTAGVITFKFMVRDTGDTTTTTVTATTFGTPLVNTYYFLDVYHDSVNDVIGIAVNNGTANTAATSGGVRDGTAIFSIGQHTAGSFFSGRVDSIGIWKRLLTSAERTWMYNSGSGRTYAELIGYTAQTTLVAWWDFEENSGSDKIDRVAALHLAESGSPLFSVGQVVGPPMNGDQLSWWYDMSGSGNNVNQTSATFRPLFATSSTYNPGHAAVVFDGSNDRFSLASFVTAFTGSDKPITVIVAAASNGVASATTLISFGNAATATQFMAFDKNSATQRINRTDDAASNKATTGGTLTTQVPYILSYVFTGTTGDTVMSGTTGTLATDLDVGAATFDLFTVGALGKNAYTLLWSGEIYEILIYNRALSLRERKQVERYLGKKWHLQAGLLK